MEKIIALLFCSFFVFSCSRIGFYAEQESNSLANRRLDSLTCDDDKVNCIKNGEEGNPFLRARHESRPGHLTEYFEISERNELEFVIVVDTSPSMDDNLKKVGENMQPVLSHIHDKDWRMVFITADHGDHGKNTSAAEAWENYQGDQPRFGRFMRLEKNRRLLKQVVLTKDTPDYEQIFKDTLTRLNGSDCRLPPGCHGSHEQPLRSLQAAFSRYNTEDTHKQFFQDNTDTIVLLITDEDERRKDPENATTAEEVITSFNTIFKRKEKRLFAFSLSIQDRSCYEKERTGFFKTAAYGHIVGRLAELTGSPEHNVSLCSRDYGIALAHISKITRSLMESNLVLQKLFLLPETVDVSLDPPHPHVSWDLFGRKVRLSGPIQPGTLVKVRYQYEDR